MKTHAKGAGNEGHERIEACAAQARAEWHLSMTAVTTHGPSFLRWAGSKRQSLARLRTTLPDQYERYVEPFAGSAALFFALRPARALLGDLNSLLVNAMTWVREDYAGIVQALCGMPRDEASYYRYRAELNALDHNTKRAAILFIYVNRNCFNGLWRTNKLGQFNVPFGGTQIGNYPPEALFAECASALAKAEVFHQDFRETISACGLGDVIFADPPYFTATERTFVEYGHRSFGASDLSDLIDLLVDAEERGAKVVLTYSAAMEISAIPEHWLRKQIAVTRNVGGFRDSRRSFGETIYSSPVAEVKP